MFGFEKVESLLNVLTEVVIQLDYDVDDIVISLKADKSSRASIPTQEVPEDNLVQVVVGEIFYPTKLYIQLASQYDKLNELMDLLDMFYARDDNSSELSLAGCEVGEGDLVAVPWTDNMWYRGRVMGVKDLTTLRVFYLDYGSVADVKRSSARLLASQFLYLPAQALLTKLSGLLPAGGKKWASASTGRLSQLTRNSHMMGLQAIIMGREGGKLAIWLIDKEGVGINQT